MSCEKYSESLASPLFEIFSVCINPPNDDGKSYAVYGSITVTEVLGSTFYLYDREKSEAEILGRDGKLSLLPDDVSFLGYSGITIDLCLKDRMRSIELINKKLYLDPETNGTKVSYDKLTKVDVQGEHCSAHLYYIALRFGLSASVDVRWIEKGDSDSDSADVSGSLTASYGNSRKYCTSDDELKHLDMILFQEPSNKPVEVKFGEPFELLRDVVSVPAYSSLVIKADLLGSEGHFAKGSVEFSAQSGWGLSEEIEFNHGRIRVKVLFDSCHRRYYEEVKQRRSTIMMAAQNIQDGESRIRQPSEQAQVQLDYQNSPPLSLFGTLRRTRYDSDSRPYGPYGVEFFSLCVGGTVKELSALCGSVKVDTGGRPFLIFHRDSSNPEIEPADGKLLCLEYNRPIQNPRFNVMVDLKDPVQSLEVSNGCISCSSGFLEGAYRLIWYNKHICSVLRGDGGYAALHYMVFDYAVSAFVEVTFSCDDAGCVPNNLYGLLVAYYGDYKYTPYFEKYYQSRLFDKPRHKSVQLTPGSALPLSKTVVAVHVKSSLVIRADLKAVCNCNAHEDALKGKLVFMIDHETDGKTEIRGKFCRIEVSVRFEKW